LITGAHALTGAQTGQSREAFTSDEMRPGGELYFEQVDNPSGTATYRLHVAEASADRVVFDVENVTRMRYLFIPVFDPGEMQSVYFLDREGDNVWRYYSESSAINRAVAFCRIPAGIPTAQEPPAARWGVRNLAARGANGDARASELVVKLTAFLIAALSMTGASSVASAFADPAPQAVESAPENAAPIPEDIVVEAGPSVAVTPMQRLGWFDKKTFGVLNLGGSAPLAAWLTFRDQPREAGPHWGGFAERYGVSVSTTALSNAMEAGLGAIWGEDPRYFRDHAGASLKSRLGRVVKWTVAAPNGSGELRPAYARFIALSGSSFISNGWREPSDTDAEHSLSRIGFGLLGRMGSNAVDEFWPDIKRTLFHRAARI
jgi:hypothetical protein